ncbi:DUF1127 domain-containing protein [Vibrio profundum]|uniref:DUF1127 domain-containing protein n=1 Tax=Vibrio profundum TaxID=2910247 RepID=UPI003D113215
MQSIYLQVATLLVRADLRREQRNWLRHARRDSYITPFHHKHLLRDIGLDIHGQLLNASQGVNTQADRKMLSIRRTLVMRPIT